MYEYRKMSGLDQSKIVQMRIKRGMPLHEPPHFGVEKNVYHLSAACFNHLPIMNTTERRAEWENALLALFEKAEADVHSWVILPNHWHALVTIALPDFSPLIGRLNNGKATQWNREDGITGRKVWYRFSDRYIRNERHYFASINYIHANPVKHKYVKNSKDWKWSSLQSYLSEVGYDTLKEWWKDYPVQDYGKGWDD